MLILLSLAHGRIFSTAHVSLATTSWFLQQERRETFDRTLFRYLQLEPVGTQHPHGGKNKTNTRPGPELACDVDVLAPSIAQQIVIRLDPKVVMFFRFVLERSSFKFRNLVQPTKHTRTHTPTRTHDRSAAGCFAHDVELQAGVFGTTCAADVVWCQTVTYRQYRQ